MANVPKRAPIQAAVSLKARIFAPTLIDRYTSLLDLDYRFEETMRSSKSQRSRSRGKQSATSSGGAQRVVPTAIDTSKATAAPKSQTDRAKRVTTKRRSIPRWVYGAGLVIIVLIALPLYRTLTRPQVGEAVSILLSPHVQPGTQTNYNSNPPTSGAHLEAVIAPWGVTSIPQDDIALIHNLEHGGIVLHYTPDLDAGQRQQLIDLANDLRRIDRKVVLAPREANDAPITATAWGRILKLDAFDAMQLRAFFEANRNNAPEQEPS